MNKQKGLGLLIACSFAACAAHHRISSDSTHHPTQSQLANNSSAYSEDSVLDPLFKGIQQHLNFYDREVTKSIPEFEKKLLHVAADHELDLVSTDTTLQHRAAMTQLYAALFMTNTNHAAELGLISYQDLIRVKQYAKKRALKDEMVARENEVFKLLNKAAPGLASDRRMPSWLTGAKLDLARLSGNADSVAAQPLIPSAIDYPNFNLFSAYLATRGVSLSPEQADTLLNLTLKMADPKQSPCNTIDGRTDTNCVGTWKAPFNYQTAVALMGDVLLKKAELYLTATPPNFENGMKLAYTAIGIYSSAFSEQRKEQTAEWPFANSLTDRIAKAKLLVSQRKSIVEYWATKSGIQVYQCASCHSGINHSLEAYKWNSFNPNRLAAQR